MLDNVPTHQFVHIFRFPREVRLLELALLFSIFFYLVTRPFPRKLGWICFLFSAFFLLGLAGILRNNISFSALQDLFIRIVPFLLFISSSIVGVKEISLRKGMKVVLYFICASILIAVCFQFPYTYYFEDFISGFFANAHNFATWLAIASIVLFYDYIQTRSISSFVFAIAMIAISVLPSNEKVFFLTLLILLIMYFRNVVGAWSRLKRITLYVGIFVVFIAGLIRADKFLEEDTGIRLQIAINYGLQNLGPVVAWPIAVSEIASSPLAFVNGVGAGQYGWIAAGREVAEGRGSLHSNQFDIEFSTENPNNSGFLFRTNTWSSLLAEFGWVGFVIFFSLVYLVVRGVIRAVPQNRFEANLRVAFFAIIGLVFFQGFFTPYSNWSESVLMFPAMYIASFFFNPKRKTPIEPEIG